MSTRLIAPTAQVALDMVCDRQNGLSSSQRPHHFSCCASTVHRRDRGPEHHGRVPRPERCRLVRIRLLCDAGLAAGLLGPVLLHRVYQMVVLSKRLHLCRREPHLRACRREQRTDRRACHRWCGCFWNEFWLLYHRGPCDGSSRDSHVRRLTGRCLHYREHGWAAVGRSAYGESDVEVVVSSTTPSPSHSPLSLLFLFCLATLCAFVSLFWTSSL